MVCGGFARADSEKCADLDLDRQWAPIVRLQPPTITPLRRPLARYRPAHPLLISFGFFLEYCG